MPTNDRYEKHKEYYKAYQKRHYKNKDKAEHHLKVIKQRANKNSIPFNLTIEDMVLPNYCPVLGIPIERSIGRGASDNSPSVDRMIPSLGYVKGNVQIISQLANRIKSSATLEQLKALVKYMELNTNG